jgi:hypothetical protein
MTIKSKVKTDAPKSEDSLVIKAPNLRTALFEIEGTAPFVQARFSGRVMIEMIRRQEAGSQAASKKKRENKDFDRLVEEAKHISKEGWNGIPATTFRGACISACRTVGFKMTLAKLSIFVEADGYDRIDNTPLIKITKGEPYRVDHAVRNATGVVDIRPRPMWDKGWQAGVRITWDDDQFSLADVSNLLARVGRQVGIGEGRPDSRQSCGMGWGLFRLVRVIPQ